MAWNGSSHLSIGRDGLTPAAVRFMREYRRPRFMWDYQTRMIGDLGRAMRRIGQE